MIINVLLHDKFVAEIAFLCSCAAIVNMFWIIHKFYLQIAKVAQFRFLITQDLVVYFFRTGKPFSAMNTSNLNKNFKILSDFFFFFNWTILWNSSSCSAFWFLSTISEHLGHFIKFRQQYASCIINFSCGIGLLLD